MRRRLQVRCLDSSNKPSEASVVKLNWKIIHFPYKLGITNKSNCNFLEMASSEESAQESSTSIEPKICKCVPL